MKPPDTLVALTGARKTPGVQYLAVNASGVTLTYSAGAADLCGHRSMEAGTTLMAYSMSKTVTAAAALQLVENGRLHLDDAIERYVPASPYGPHVLVRHLISHTSGIPNPIPLRWVHPADAHGTFDEDAALAAVLRRYPRLSGEPGTKYAYSNIGYWLLGKVVERASGAPLPSYVADRILRRLEMAPGELGYVVSDPARHAIGYLEKYSFVNLLKPFLIDRQLVGRYCGRWLEIRSHYPNGPAFGGLVGSARAFGVFLQDQLRPHSALFNDATRALFFAPQQTNDGRSIAMTLGWHIGSLNGRRFFYKEGGGGGFHCMMRLYPDSGLGSVVMCNATAFEVANLLNAVDPTFL
jgi:CubicO group peptidase (beta-lactamase class C family)